MEKDQEHVVVEYHTRTDYCRCCGQELKEPITSKMKEFYFVKENFTEWLKAEHWKAEAEVDDSFTSMVHEFVYDTISFYATSSDARLIIEPSELQKAKKFCLEKVCLTVRPYC